MAVVSCDTCRLFRARQKAEAKPVITLFISTCLRGAPSTQVLEQQRGVISNRSVTTRMNILYKADQGVQKSEA